MSQGKSGAPISASEVRAGAAAIGIELSDDQARRIAQHAEAVYQTNEVMNLTRVTPENALRDHVLDSLAGLSAMRAAPDGPWVDLGSGAGYPGVVLAIAGARHVDLVESVGKKAAFLSTVVADLRLDVAVRGVRAEDAAREARGAYAAVSARALSELPALVELAAPFLAQHGRLVCWKGAPSDAEIGRGDKAADLVGMRRLGFQDVVIPGSDARRTLVVYEKTGGGRVRLPRRVGLAQSKPLA